MQRKEHKRTRQEEQSPYDDSMMDLRPVQSHSCDTILKYLLGLKHGQDGILVVIIFGGTREGGLDKSDPTKSSPRKPQSRDPTYFKLLPPIHHVSEGLLPLRILTARARLLQRRKLNHRLRSYKAKVLFRSVEYSQVF